MRRSHSSPYLSRREFFRRAAALGGAAALAAALQACGTPGADQAALITPTPEQEPAELTQEPPLSTQTSTSKPEPTLTGQAPLPTAAAEPEEGTARVAFVRTSDRAGGVRRAVDLLGLAPFSGQHVFIKPNFNSADPAPGSTHPDVLAALVIVLKAMGAERITVGDRSGMGDTRRVMEQIGVFDMGEQLGFDTIVFDELAAEDWVLFQPEELHWRQGFAIARPCLEADALVQTCCLKTHRYGGHFTLSLKNSVGMAAKQIPGASHNYMSELHSSRHQRRMIAEINAAYTPALVVLDGVEAFISGGPDRGEKVDSQVMLAGTDRIAIDAAGVALLRYHGCRTEAARGRIFEQEQIARAVELGIGVDRPDKIEFVTDDPESAAYSKEIRELLLAG